jgi:hypothetical protein
MKLLSLTLLLPLAFVPVSVEAQQVNAYGVCTQYREIYTPGYTDQYGNYVAGSVSTQSFNVPCNGSVATTQPPQQYYQRQRVCNPAAGAAMIGGLAEALSGGRGWKSNSNWKRNYNRNNNSSSGRYNYSNRNYTSNGWTIFGAGLGALLYSC